MDEKIFIGMFFCGVGLLFFFLNKSIGKGAYQFYKKIYTEKNLVIIFKILGGLLFLGGLAIIFIK